MSLRNRSGVGQWSVRSWSGVGQESVGSLSGVSQESVRSRSGVGKEFAQNLRKYESAQELIPSYCLMASIMLLSIILPRHLL